VPAGLHRPEPENTRLYGLPSAIGARLGLLAVEDGCEPSTYLSPTSMSVAVPPPPDAADEVALERPTRLPRSAAFLLASRQVVRRV
jgi:hypothetical protein